MIVWLVRGWYYRDDAPKIIGIFATKKAAEQKVERLTIRHGDITTYDVSRHKVIGL